LDDATVGFLFGRLREATGELAADLTIDMGLLTFIDSTGLSLPVTLDKHVRALRWTLTLTDPTPMRAACFRSRHWIRC
jgi:anti-anti-sigma regulatory factor